MPGEMPLGEELVDEEDAKGGEGEVIWARSPATACSDISFKEHILVRRSLGSGIFIGHPILPPNSSLCQCQCDNMMRMMTRMMLTMMLTTMMARTVRAAETRGWLAAVCDNPRSIFFLSDKILIIKDMIVVIFFIIDCRDFSCW